MQKILLVLLLVIFPSLAFGVAGKEDPPLKSGAFPLAMYAVSASDANFSRMREMGVNYVHLYGLSRGPNSDEMFARVQNYLDLAQKHGLKVMLDLDGARRVPQNELEEMREIVRRFKDHPALGFWYLFDEPDNHKVTTEQLEPFYRMIKAETPDISVAVCHAWTTNWYRFKELQDILVHDIYPVTGAAFPHVKLQQQTKFTEAALTLNETVVPVLQLFNWQSMAKPEEKELRGYPVAELRYPNTAEMRYLCFSTIAQGARGLAFYSYARGVMTDPNWISQTAKPVLREVREFTDLIRSAKPLQRLREAEKSQLLLSLWQNEDETYIVLVNASPEARPLEYSAAVIAAGELQPVGSTRKTNATLKGGKLTVAQAEPWEVFIWKLVP